MNKDAGARLSGNLRDMIQQTFIRHVEKEQGLICGPERLLESVLDTVRLWVQQEEMIYSNHDCTESAEVLRDLRHSLIDG